MIIRKIQKKHKAPKGLYGQVLLIIAVIALLIQYWFNLYSFWPVVIIVPGLSFILISHYKRRRRDKKSIAKQEGKKIL